MSFLNLIGILFFGGINHSGNSLFFRFEAKNEHWDKNLLLGYSHNHFSSIILHCRNTPNFWNRFRRLLIFSFPYLNRNIAILFAHPHCYYEASLASHSSTFVSLIIKTIRNPTSFRNSTG